MFFFEKTPTKLYKGLIWSFFVGKRFVQIILIVISFLLISPFRVYAAQTEEESIGIEAPHAVLMEVSTGTVLYEKEAHAAVPPASVTKIMTLLLIFDALEKQKIRTQLTEEPQASSLVPGT